MHPEQKKIFKSMTPERKLEIAEHLYECARELKAAALHDQHPNWTDKEIQEKVREVFLYART